MEAAFLAGVAIAIVAGFFNGVFNLPLRYARNWEWENTWLVFSLFSLVIFPWVAAYIFVPQLPALLKAAPFSFFVPGLIAGLVWGLSFVLYGVGMDMVGIAVGNAVVACTSATSGTIGPLIVYAPDKLLSKTGILILVAIVLIVAGIYTYAKAGRQKERETTGLQTGPSAPPGNFRAGMVICLITGPLGTVFIYGVGSSKGLLNAALAHGTNPIFAGCIAMALTFSVGFSINALYCLYLLNKNRTFPRYGTGHFARNCGLALIMASFWFPGLLLYAVAAAKMGRLGPSVGFGLFASGTVLFANFLGWRAGEWKGASTGTVHGFVRGMLLVVIAIAVIAFGVH